MECNYDQPCGDGQMCDLHKKECRPLTVPKEKNRLLVGTQSGAFVGRSTAIDLMIARQFTQQLGVPCALGKEGITTEDEFVEAISEGEDLVAIIDLFTGENLCLMWEELKEAWENSQMGLYFVEGKAEQGERKEVVNFPYWENKYILKSVISRQLRVEKYMFAIVPTQYRIELTGNRRYLVYHVVPVGPYRQELIEVKQPEFPRQFPEDLEGVIAEFRGPQLLEMTFADVADGEDIMSIAFNGVYLVVTIGSEDELVGLIVIWDTRHQKLVRQKPVVVPFHDINSMFSPKDPNILAYGAEGQDVSIWNLDTNQSVDIGHATFVSPRMAFDDNGIFYYLGSDYSISRYDVVRQQYIGVINSRQEFIDFTVNRQGTRLIAVTNLNNLRVFDLEIAGSGLDDKLIKERRLNLPGSDISSLDTNSNGDVVVFTTNRGDMMLWFPDTDDDFVRLEIPSEATTATDVHFNSSNTRILALVTDEGVDEENTSICVWDSDSLELIQVIPIKSPAIDMIVDPVNPQRVLTSDMSGLVKMWEIME